MKPFLIFLLIVLFFASLSTILMELALTKVFSIVLWYDYAFIAISVAFFGLEIGTVMAATLAMMIGFSGNLLFGLGTHAGAAASATLALFTIKRAQVAVMGDRQ